MGFLRRLFGGGKKHHHPQPPPGSHDGSGQKPGKEKRNWSFVKQSTRDKSNNSNNRRYDPSSAADSLDANKHAIAVAAATAAVAEAALAAAHAAAQVVRLTGGGRPATAAEVQRRLAEEIAAVKIQSAFRGYLARRALRALKALVKLQSLVRGHIVRKKTADMLKRMQTLVRLQARARAGRVHLSDNNNMSSFNSSLSHYPVPEDYEHPLRAYSTKFDGSSVLKRCSSNSNYRDIGLERTRFGSSWREESGWSQTGNNASLRNGHIIDDEKSDKILEVDTWKPHLSSHHHHNVNHNNIVAYDQSPLKHSSKGLNPRTAENSPQAFSASYRLGSSARRGGPFTPTKSECSWGFFNGYSSHPNYMANTESSRAKVRSHSAPRQRLEFDRYGSNRRFVQGLWDAGPNLSSSHLNRVGNTKLR